MKKEISTNLIQSFQEQYHKKDSKKRLEKRMIQEGIDAVCFRDANWQDAFSFQIELPNTNIYDQEDSFSCWIYAGINALQLSIAKEMNIDPCKLALSANYIFFYDKLEKANRLYEQILQMEHPTIEQVMEENILIYAVYPGGYFEQFKAIVHKYGMVPASVMKESYQSLHQKRGMALLKEKVEQDVLFLIELKEKNVSMEELRKKKEEMLYEVFEYLCMILGEPPMTFDFTYVDLEGKTQSFSALDGVTFKNRFLTWNVEDFISVGNLPMKEKPYYKKYEKKYLGNVPGKSEFFFLNLPIEELKRLSIEQLKSGMPVMVLLDNSKRVSNEKGIMALDAFSYEELLGIPILNKENACAIFESTIIHSMNLVGVQLEEGKAVRWKVLDSHGDRGNHGYFSMQDDFFDHYVFDVIIHKQFLSEEYLTLLEEKAEEIPVDYVM